MSPLDNAETIFRLELTAGQAAAISAASDLFVRIGIGQLEEVVRQARHGFIPRMGKDLAAQRESATLEQCDELANMASHMKAVLGYHPNASHGIGHPHNDINVTRAWEVKKVLDKVLAEYVNPNPTFRGLNYDGLVVRYTTDRAPVATAISPAGAHGSSSSAAPPCDADHWSTKARSIASELLDGPMRSIVAERAEDGLGLAHLRWMTEQLAGGQVQSGTKACRWLGYIQGGLIAAGLSTLDQEKQRNANG